MNITTTEIFNNEILSKVSFNQMRKYRAELSRGVTNDLSFTNMICNGIIGILTPWATCEVHGIFYATGEAINTYIRKVKQNLGMYNFNCVIKIDNNKDYVINNTIPGFMTICEAH